METLLLSHNSDESAVLRQTLQRAGLVVRISTELEKIVGNWNENTVELFVLTFPNRDLPTNLIKQLRALTSVPIVVICEPQTEDTHVGLLNAGIDWVSTRPYSSRLFIAQVRSLMRRTSGVPLFSLPVLTAGDIHLDPSERSVTVLEQEPRRLTQLEFRLLYILMINAGHSLSSERLIEHIWGYTGKGNRDLVRGLVKRLRTKIEKNSQEPRYVITISGAGYKLQI